MLPLIGLPGHIWGVRISGVFAGCEANFLSIRSTDTDHKSLLRDHKSLLRDRQSLLRTSLCLLGKRIRLWLCVAERSDRLPRNLRLAVKTQSPLPDP
jgi:hypothetical protein